MTLLSSEDVFPPIQSNETPSLRPLVQRRSKNTRNNDVVVSSMSAAVVNKRSRRRGATFGYLSKLFEINQANLLQEKQQRNEEETSRNEPYDKDQRR